MLCRIRGVASPSEKQNERWPSAYLSPWRCSRGGHAGVRGLHPGPEQATEIQWVSSLLGPREVHRPPARQGLGELPTRVGGLLRLWWVTRGLGKRWILNGGGSWAMPELLIPRHTLGIYRCKERWGLFFKQTSHLKILAFQMLLKSYWRSSNNTVRRTVSAMSAFYSYWTGARKMKHTELAFPSLCLRLRFTARKDLWYNLH